ncbi:MAG: DUF4430 domain-containing protein [Lachnospiraceae bacterium]|nr:DUF4430 domain-containing protein [Lachnospiraceae bacterium]
MNMKKRFSALLAAGMLVAAPVAVFADDEATTAASEVIDTTKEAESVEGEPVTKAVEGESEGDTVGATTGDTDATVPAVDAKTVEVSAHVRIEGIDKMMYNNDVTVSVAEGAKATVKDVLMGLDAQTDDITIVGADSNYITEVNGVKAATYGGWDGWMYQVNGTAAAVGIDAYEIAAGDSIVLYYSDEYGVGMDYPIMNTEKIADKKLSFTSMKTTYDAEGKASTAEVKVTGMDVTIGGETYKTDDNGEITLSDAVMAKLPAELTISKYAENGCPLVLRYAPGTIVAAPASATPTGDATPVAWLFVIAAGAAVATVAARKKNQA